MPDRDEILGQAADWLSAGKKVALATVIDTWGSSPRPVGSQLAVDKGGDVQLHLFQQKLTHSKRHI